MSPANQPQRSTHATAARRALRQLLAAKRRGDQQAADVYAQLMKEAVDQHLASLRVMRR